MKIINKFFRVGFVFLVLTGLCSCKKYVAGPKGDTGTPGKSGNAIQSTRSFQPLSWTFNGAWWNTSINVPEITDNVIANGEVEVYMQINDQWWALPYAVGDVFMQMSIEKNWVRLKYSKIHDGPPAQPSGVNFRVVVTAPAVN